MRLHFSRSSFLCANRCDGENAYIGGVVQKGSAAFPFVQERRKSNGAAERAGLRFHTQRLHQSCPKDNVCAKVTSYRMAEVEPGTAKRQMEGAGILAFCS